MAYVLSSTTIRRPVNINESDSTLVTEHKALDASVSRDYFGSNKRMWTLDYQNVNVDDYESINTIYQDYVSNSIPKSWQSTEPNNIIDITTVHVDLIQRDFTIHGYTMLSDFSLILTES